MLRLSRIAKRTPIVGRSFLQPANLSQLKISSQPKATTQLFYNNQFVDSNASKYYTVLNPSTQNEVTLVPEITVEEFNRAVENTVEAQKEWASTPVPLRARVLMDYAKLVRDHQDIIAESITIEHGKTIADSKGDIFRGLEVIEHATNVSTLLMGETVRDISRGIDLYSYKEPLGVCAGICPFNFPSMIPLWMFPLSIACGNGFILKPSEKTPTASMILMELLQQVNVPSGLVNVVHGGVDCVNLICDHPDIKAVSFVGGNSAGEHIHQRATSHNKRAQCNMGAKNHGTVLSDADKQHTIAQLCGASFGSSGQRCMALPVVLLVGESRKWIPDIIEAAKTLTIGPGHENVDIAPLNTAAARDRVNMLIQSAIDEGAKVVLDGRNPKVEGYPKGNFVGATIIIDIESHMKCYREEIFGPVMLIKCCDTIDEAIKFTNDNPYGNGTALFTNSGSAARKYEKEIEAGQIGINLPIPVPLPFFSFTGSKHSFRGARHFYGKQGVDFFTYTKTITSNWKFSDYHHRISTVMPTYE